MSEAGHTERLEAGSGAEKRPPMTMRCEACGAEVAPGSLECGRCGAELATVRLATEALLHTDATTRIVEQSCAECGEGLSVGARFCQACGAASRTDDDLFKQARTAAATARDSFLEQVRRAASKRYELIRELGHGGFATVLLAHEKALGRDVALKVLHMNLMHDEDLVQRFAAEARTLASLRHRHVLRIHAVEDFAVAQVNFDGGRSLALQCSWASHIKAYDDGLEIWGLTARILQGCCAEGLFKKGTDYSFHGNE